MGKPSESNFVCGNLDHVPVAAPRGPGPIFEHWKFHVTLAGESRAEETAKLNMVLTHVIFIHWWTEPSPVLGPLKEHVMLS